VIIAIRFLSLKLINISLLLIKGEEEIIDEDILVIKIYDLSILIPISISSLYIIYFRALK
jgi:hypothetical protein